MIGDTDFFIDLMHPKSKRHARALAKAKELEGFGVRIAMTALTRFELAAGVEMYVKPQTEREKVKALLTAHATYNLDGDTADLAGAIHGSLQVKGSAIGIADVLIAAIAMSNGEELLTSNVSELGRIEGLSIVSY